MNLILKRLSIVTLVVLSAVLFSLPTYAADSDFKIEDGKLVEYLGSDTEVEIPSGVTSIGYHAFNHNETIESVIIPESVTSIDAYAFQMCMNLKIVEIPDSVVEIGRNAFDYTPFEEDKQNEREDGLVIYGSVLERSPNCKEKKVVIPEGVVTINPWSFFENPYIQEIVVAKSVKQCGSGCFALCKSLKTITFLNKKTVLNIDHVTLQESWEEGAFFPSLVMDNEELEPYYKIAKSTLTIKGYGGSTAETLAQKLVAFPYGYKTIKFYNLKTKKTTTYGVKIPSTLTVSKGKKKTLEVILPKGMKRVDKNPKEGVINKVTVSFKSSNPAVATVNSKGVITGKKKGTTTITTTVSFGKNISYTSLSDNNITFKKTYTTTVKVK